MLMIKDFNKDAIICGEKRISYTQLLQHIRHYSEQFPRTQENNTVKPAEQRNKVVIFCENRPGFIYAFFSVWANNDIAVPVDAQSSAEELRYVVEDCTPHVVWTTRQKADIVTTAVQGHENEVRILYIDDFEDKALEKDYPFADISYELANTALIIYTSGTTGSPKGVMLSFMNLLTNIKSVSEDVTIYRPDRRALILLPLHHVLPLQGTMIAPIILGAGVAIAPSMLGPDIMKTLQDGKVGLFIGVPRLWQSLYQGIMKQINASALTRFLYWLCKCVNRTWFSKIIFKKIHTMMGGHLEACPSGGAALDAETWKGLHTLGIDIIEGYGMTECAPIITFSRPDDLRPGCVGRRLPSCWVTIIADEICVKGENVMQGYYKKPQETAEVLDGAGWLHTGDMGYLDNSGHLYITGRKKEIIVLSNGKNVNPSDIEIKLEEAAEYVREAAVIEENDSLKAIICPQPKWAEGKSKDDVEKELKLCVVTKYNKKAQNYKKLSGLYVYYGDLPRTRMDKIQRFKLKSIAEECRRQFDESEHFENSQKIDVPEEYEFLASFIKSCKGVEPKPLDNLTADLGFDSLDIVSLQSQIFETFGFEISQERLLSFDNLARLTEYIATKKTHALYHSTSWKNMLINDMSEYKVPPMKSSGWHAVSVTRRLVRSYFSFKAYGIENLPKNGPYILAANHQSFLDALFVVQGLKREQFNNLCFFAKEEHVKGSLVRYLARNHGVIVLHKKSIMESILHMGQALRCGKTLVIFPEGTRTEDGKVHSFRPTFAILSKALDVPIVSVCIEGANLALPKHSKIPHRKPVKVTYLTPVFPQDYADEDTLAKDVHSIIEHTIDFSG